MWQAISVSLCREAGPAGAEMGMRIIEEIVESRLKAYDTKKEVKVSRSFVKIL
jgi:hypothetical protein